MSYIANDVVRIVKVDAGTMIAPYLGQEGRVVEKSPDDKLYLIEVDVGRATPDRAGQLGPRFVVREDQIDPDVTEKMLEAARKVLEAWDDTQLIGQEPMAEEVGLARDVYRAMRAARFER